MKFFSGTLLWKCKYLKLEHLFEPFQVRTEDLRLENNLLKMGDFVLQNKLLTLKHGNVQSLWPNNQNTGDL